MVIRSWFSFSGQLIGRVRIAGTGIEYRRKPRKYKKEDKETNKKNKADRTQLFLETKFSMSQPIKLRSFKLN